MFVTLLKSIQKPNIIIIFPLRLNLTRKYSVKNYSHSNKNLDISIRPKRFNQIIFPLIPHHSLPKHQFISVQLLSRVRFFATPWTTARQASCPSSTPRATQTHVHWVGDAIQPSHPLSSPSPHALNLPQHQGPFKWVNSSDQVAKVLEFQLQHQSFQWIVRVDFL